MVEKARVRLEVLPQRSGRLQVDRAFPGSIRGLSVITAGPALGHGFDVDETTVRQVDQAVEGVSGRWTHGGLSEDGLGKHLGQWRRRGVEEFGLCRACSTEAPLSGGQRPACPECGQPMERAHRAIGDFQFSESAYKIKPDGLRTPAPLYLMQRAEEDPSSFGVSIVALFDQEELAVTDANGREVGKRRFARLAAPTPEHPRPLSRADFVADPAANPVGLHAGTGALSALSEESTHQLDQIVERVGVEAARGKAIAFLDRYFGRLAVNKPATTPQDTPAAEAPTTATAPSTTPTQASAAPSPKAEDISVLKARLAVAEAESAELRAALSAHREAEAARKKALAEGYVREIKERAAKLGSAIPEEDVKKVEAAFARGDDETAKDLGSAFLSRSEARSGSSSGSTKTVPLFPATRTGSELQDEALSQQGYERDANGNVVKRKA